MLHLQKDPQSRAAYVYPLNTKSSIALKSKLLDKRNYGNYFTYQKNVFTIIPDTLDLRHKPQLQHWDSGWRGYGDRYVLPSTSQQ